MRKLLTLLLMSIIYLPLSLAQDEEYENVKSLHYEDHIYKDGIKTVQFQSSLLGYQPIVNLKNDFLRLSFDELSDEINDYYYTIVHCNADWTLSDRLTTMDYIDGFSSKAIIQDAFSSSNTLTNFIHYQVILPNEDFQWTKSGNYLLKVFQDEEEANIVLTRRFMVVDRQMKIEHVVRPAVNSEKNKTHQEIDFVVERQGFQIQNPQIEVKVTVLQNGRWDNAITDIKPLFVRPDQLLYDYQDKIVFGGGRDFRYVNLQSFQYLMGQFKTLLQDTIKGQIVELMTEKTRVGMPNVNDSDLNGNFYIRNENENDSRTESDYAWVRFSLTKDLAIEDGSVYIFGKLTDWKINEHFKMTYNTILKTYETKVQLKQGFYDYMYVFVSNQAPDVVDLTEFEGHSYETDNEYTILVYYRPFGGQYDQLVAVKFFHSRD